MENHQKELRRMDLQRVQDSTSTLDERNETGQFSTPPELAFQILRYASQQTEGEPKVRFLDPGVGTGAFYSALLSTTPSERLEHAHGYEIHQGLAAAATELWHSRGLTVHHQDFTSVTPPDQENRFNLVICNPPYVRHHHIGTEKKRELKERLASQGNMELNGLAGLYAHFIGLTHPWMSQRALAGWLIPSEFMDVNYGKGVRDYLTSKVTLLHIHRFDPETSQFKDALVSSAVVWFRNSPPPRTHKVKMTFGGTLEQPALESKVPLETLRKQRKWSQYPATLPAPERNHATLSDLFNIKRGIATGNNSFFVVTEQEAKQKKLPKWALVPVLPGARKLEHDLITADQEGLPQLANRLFLLDCDLDENTLARKSPALAQYLQEGLTGVSETYICSHRSPWYSQEKRPPAPFLCTYMGRLRKDSHQPFRFILNLSKATALNVYLMMYPKEPLATMLESDPDLKKAAWEALKSIGPADLMREGRVYGGGLRKVEPKELGRVGADRILEALHQR